MFSKKFGWILEDVIFSNTYIKCKGYKDILYIIHIHVHTSSSITEVTDYRERVNNRLKSILQVP